MNGLLFELPKTNSKEQVINLAKKANKYSGNKRPTVMTTINQIRNKIKESIGKYKDLYVLVETLEQLRDYIDIVVRDGIAVIDVETTGLDPMEDKLVGFSIKCPSLPSFYVPYGHISPYTKEPYDDQIKRKDLVEQLSRISNISSIWHNSPFDIRILGNNLGVWFTNILWDTLSASCLIDENEPHKLKYLYDKYCNVGEDSEIFNFSDLFDNMNFSEVPIDVGYIYGARDSHMTYELYLFQKAFFNEPQNSKLKYVLENIEIPVLTSVIGMEQRGFTIDKEYATTLSEKYNELLVEAQKKFVEELQPYEEKILKYNSTHYGVLDNPINHKSPQQLAILLYDIIGVGQISRKEPRGTGEDILLKIDLPICKAILTCREYEKLIGTYIDNIPKMVNERTGRLHCKFNPNGAVTGRFSSSSPNLQNIPSKNQDIRKMFVPKKGYVLLSADFSQQEPRIFAHLSGDKNLIKAYKENKDLYAWSASLVYKVPYEECMEKYSDGTSNPMGKKRRSAMKAIILGILYDKGVKAIAEDLGITKKEADNLYEVFFNSFPNARKFIDNAHEFAKKNGYLEMLWGKKRRLPNMQLERYEFDIVEGYSENDDLLDFSAREVEYYISDETKKYYTKLMDAVWSKEKTDEVKRNALSNGILITDNRMKIADAERQCVNSVIQGSAALQTKLAMSIIDSDKIFNKLRGSGGIIAQVHDEILVEVPYETRLECAEVIKNIMENCAKEVIPDVPFRCDIEITDRWYGEEV